MKRRTYCITSLLGIGAALIAGAVFASSFWQSLTGLILGVAMLVFGFIISDEDNTY